MQVRKLIRMLNEMVENDPSVAYKKVCVDKRYTENFDNIFREVSDVMTQECYGWNDNVDKQLQVVVIGNF